MVWSHLHAGGQNLQHYSVSVIQLLFIINVLRTKGSPVAARGSEQSPLKGRRLGGSGAPSALTLGPSSLETPRLPTLCLQRPWQLPARRGRLPNAAIAGLPPARRPPHAASPAPGTQTQTGVLLGWLQLPVGAPRVRKPLPLLTCQCRGRQMRWEKKKQTDTPRRSKRFLFCPAPPSGEAGEPPAAGSTPRNPPRACVKGAAGERGTQGGAGRARSGPLGQACAGGGVAGGPGSAVVRRLRACARPVRAGTATRARYGAARSAAPRRSASRRRQMVFTSRRAARSSSARGRCSRRASSAGTAARPLRRAASTNGNPKRARYRALSSASRRRSSASRRVSPAAVCSRRDSAVSVPSCSSRPARSGWQRRTPSWPAGKHRHRGSA